MKIRDMATFLMALAALIAAGTSAVVSFNTQQAVYQVHLSINSRMDQLVKATRESAHAAGVEEGRDEPEEPEEHDDRDD